jgi:hypothetical protein
MNTGIVLVLVITGVGGIVYGVSTNGKAAGLGLATFGAGLTALFLHIVGVR